MRQAMNASLRPADGLHAGPPDAGLATLALAQWPGDVAILGTDLRMEWINDRFAQRIGFSPKTCIGLDWPARCVRGSTPATCCAPRCGCGDAAHDAPPRE
jgi:hypothetical protein